MCEDMCEALPFVGDGITVVYMFRFFTCFFCRFMVMDNWIYRHVADGLPSIRMSSVGRLPATNINEAGSLLMIRYLHFF
jgi:hypothetical protein